MSESTTTGARSLSGRRTPLGWLPWAALALLAFLVIRNVADAGDQPGVDVTNDRLGGATESGSAGSAGRLRPVPANVASLGVDEAEGAAQLRSQGQSIEAMSVVSATDVGRPESISTNKKERLHR